MHFTYLLRLVSERRAEQIKGYSKDPDWPGWIPVQSFVNKNIGNVTGSSGGAAGGRAGMLLGNEFVFVIKPEDVDFSALQRWVIQGEPISAKLNAVPAAVGEEGFQFVFDGAVLSAFSPTTAAISFTLNFQNMERRYLLRYR